MKSKVCITGATGFLGKYLVRYFTDKGYSVHAMGRNEIEGLKLECPSVKFIKGSLECCADVEAAVAGCELVIHAGAKSSPWGPYHEFYAANVTGTRHVLLACGKFNVKRLVHISSPSIYTEKRDRIGIKEEDAKSDNRLNDYIRTKLMAERLVLAHSCDFERVILRPRGLFGIGDMSVIPRLMRANSTIGIPLFKGGENLVDITYVENVAHACWLAATVEGIHGGTYNITNGEPRQFKSLLEAFLTATGDTGHFRPMDFDLFYRIFAIIEGLFRLLKIRKEPIFTRYTLITLGYSQTLDINKARAELGYKPLFTLQEGIEIYADWYRKNSPV